MSKINLLPAEYKKDIEQAKANGKILNTLARVSWLFVGLVLVYLVTLFLMNQTLAAKTRELKENEAQVNGFGNLEEKSKKISERLTNIRTIDRKSPKWSTVISEIQRVMPSGIRLTKVKMDNQTKSRGNMSGYAATKKNVADLRNLMERSEKFKYVDIDSAGTVEDPETKKEVESFNISFTLEEGALK